MNYLFLILLCGLPFGHFIFSKFDIWQAQGQFFQIGILVLFCWSFFEKPQNKWVINKPLGVFSLWLGLLTAFWWMDGIVKTGHYPILLFFPFFNYLCFLLFYKLSIEYLDEKIIEKILNFLSYSVLIVLIYCVLQKLQLDQFYKALAEPKDELVGTIGNTGLLAGYLSLCQPLFFKRGFKNILALILLWLILIIAGSAGGIITGIVVILFWLLINKKWIHSIGLIMSLGLISILLWDKLSLFFFDSGRFEIWANVFTNFKIAPITGGGLGRMLALGINKGGLWKTAHCEPYQLALEAGIIGLVLGIWCIEDYFRRFFRLKTDLTKRLACIFLGFCVLSLTQFPAHLWLMASMGMISYSWLFVIEGEKNGFHTEGDKG